MGDTLDNTTETELHLRPKARWTGNFRVQIQAQFGELHASGVVDGGEQARLHHPHVREHVEKAFERCVEAADANAFILARIWIPVR